MPRFLLFRSNRQRAKSEQMKPKSGLGRKYKRLLEGPTTHLGTRPIRNSGLPGFPALPDLPERVPLFDFPRLAIFTCIASRERQRPEAPDENFLRSLTLPARLKLEVSPMRQVLFFIPIKSIADSLP